MKVNRLKESITNSKMPNEKYIMALNSLKTINRENKKKHSHI